MNTIFKKENNQEIVARLHELDGTNKGLWGKMTVPQMIVHCQKVLDVAEGRLKIKRTFIGFLFGGIMKKKLLKSDEMEKNLPTDKNFIIRTFHDFELEKNKLLAQVKKFETVGEEIIANKKHPFFGQLTTEEWGILCYKHLDHHLKQFGV